MIRGKAASDDEKYVTGLCRKLNIPLLVKKADVPEFARKNKLSLEDAARKKRYEFFNEASIQLGADKIALGHTLDDNVETILMRLIMGTGTRGLLGIPAKRGKIIRPLIDFWREEIEAYCKKKNLKPRIDKSNYDTKYLRNKVRHELMPILLSINPNAKTAIIKVIEILAADYEHLMDSSAKALQEATLKKSEKSIRLNTKKLKMYSDSIRRYVLRSAIEDMKGNLENIGFVHVDDIFSKLPDKEPWELHLPAGIRASGKGDVLTIRKP